MKKHPQADALAARLTDAANKPPSVVPFPTQQPEQAESPATHEPESEAAPTIQVEEPKLRKPRKARTKAQAVDETQGDTHAISLRPLREVWIRYVLAAAERTRETGRVTSAQEIMLERLDGGP